MKTIEERLKKIEAISLEKGAHSENSRMCVMEAVAFVAGEPWTDHPETACPVISTFLRSWNDALPTNADRDRLLKPLIPRLIGTKNKALEEKRTLMAADWLVRVNTPAWLRLAGLTAHADALATLPEIISMAQVPSLRGPIEAAQRDADAAMDAARAAARAAARDAARDAARAVARAVAWAAAMDAARAVAWDAARDAALAAAWAAAWAAAGDAALAAAWAAAGDAARAAARDAARDAARAVARAVAWAAAMDAARAAAWDAAMDAALAAARAAAWDAAGDAALKKLKPTMEHLQQSAIELLERMITA